jgi:hypothetical protein
VLAGGHCLAPPPDDADLLKRDRVACGECLLQRFIQQPILLDPREILSLCAHEKYLHQLVHESMLSLVKFVT